MSTQSDNSFEAGIAAIRDGRAEEAKQHFRDDLTARPDHAPTLYNLGVLEYQSGDSADAEQLLRKAAETRPDHVGTRSVLAAVLVDLKQLDDAITQAMAITQIAGADAAALNTAGQVLALVGQTARAESAYAQALVQDALYRPAALALVDLFVGRRAFEQARDVCDNALAGHPTDQDIHLRRAQALWEAGETRAARDALLDLLDFAPDHMTAHHNLALFADKPDPHATLDRLTSLLGEGVLDGPDTAKAWFTLANVFSTTNEPENALACFSEGNRVRAKQATPSHATSIAAFERHVASVIKSPLPAMQQEESGRPTPLVITGPSRSGKSLLQSWLSAHPDIAVADEVGLLPKLAEMDVASDAAHLQAAADQYRNTLASLAGDARYVIDTHPTNALYLDLLLQLCPDAKIIQMQRDPLDLAVSIFARNFVTGGHWADTWAGIANRIKCYGRLQAHYAPWAPVIATVQYEGLVADPDPMLSQIVAALALDNPPSSPQENGAQGALRPMPWASFASRSAARTESIGLWKPFAPWLGRFANAYGRATLKGEDAIPTEDKAPQSDVVTALNTFKAGQTIKGVNQTALAKVPAYHAVLAHEAERDEKWDETVLARWRAVSCRPFTHQVRHHADALDQTLSRSPAHKQLAQLHQDVSSRWTDYQEASDMRFGDFGLPYQSCDAAMIVGSRDTDVRAIAYDLEALCGGQRVLDLGCNTGFLALAAAPVAHTVVGVEHEQALVDIGSLVSRFLKAETVSLHCADATAYQSADPFNVVIAAAVHGWMAMPLAELGRRFAELTTPGGAILFESQGQRSTTVVEDEFHEKVKEVAAAGFDVERQGALCDDRVNKRAFVILRKRS